MPNSGLSSLATYVPTVNLFLAHWGLVDAALGPNPLTLAESYSREDLEGDRDSMENILEQVEEAINGVEIARADVALKRGPLQERLAQFIDVVEVKLKGTRFARAVPKPVPAGAGLPSLIKALNDMKNLWGRINAASPVPPGVVVPVTLLSGYGLATFLTDFAALRTAGIALTDEEQGLLLARGDRTKKFAEVAERLKEYRQLLPSSLAAGHPLIGTVPRLSPLPGHTPDAVNASVVWDAVEQKAKLVWEASADPDLEEYHIRRSLVNPYDSEEEVMVATVAAQAPRELLTLAGLTQSGATALFKVFVVLTTGNERGSTVLAVTRP